ncbi:MAG: hypothetical protein ABIJ61_07650 [bacterium]
MEIGSGNVDRRQMWALIRAGFKTDMRGAKNPLGSMGKSKGGFPPLLGVTLFYLLIGILMAVFLVVGRENFFASALIVNASLMTFIAISILMEFSNIILTPDDWQIVAPLPVNSKTFFCAKFVNLLIYVGILGVAVALPCTIAYAAVSGNVLAGLVVLLSLLTNALTTATFFIIVYTLMLHVADRERMNSVLGYLQLVLIFAFYFMMMVMPRQIGNFTQAIAEVDIWWLPLTPPGWFASLPALLVQPFDMVRYVGTGIGLAVLTGCVFTVLGKLSLSYAASLQHTTGAKPEQHDLVRTESHSKRGRWQPPEFRVISRLVKAQFKHDNRFKMTVLAAIPLSVMYLYLGLSKGRALLDPFVEHTADSPEGAFLIYIAVALLPLLVLSGITMSSSWQAAWVFLTSPTDRVRLVRAGKRYALLYFALPFLAIIFGVQVYFFGNALHALLHSITLYLISLIGVTLMITFTGRLPFSMPPRKGQRTATFMFGWLGPFVLVIPPMVIIGRFGYGGWMTYLIVLAVLLAINIGMMAVERTVLKKRVTGYEMSDEE